MPLDSPEPVRPSGPTLGPPGPEQGLQALQHSPSHLPLGTSTFILWRRRRPSPRPHQFSENSYKFTVAAKKTKRSQEEGRGWGLVCPGSPQKMV